MDIDLSLVSKDLEWLSGNFIIEILCTTLIAVIHSYAVILILPHHGHASKLRRVTKEYL